MGSQIPHLMMPKYLKGCSTTSGVSAAHLPALPPLILALPRPVAEDEKTTQAQRAEVQVRALLLLSKLAALRWQPLVGLQHAREACLFLGSNADK